MPTWGLKLRLADEQDAILGGLSHAEMRAAMDLRPAMQRIAFCASGALLRKHACYCSGV